METKGRILSQRFFLVRWRCGPSPPNARVPGLTRAGAGDER